MCVWDYINLCLRPTLENIYAFLQLLPNFEKFFMEVSWDEMSTIKAKGKGKALVVGKLDSI